MRRALIAMSVLLIACAAPALADVLTLHGGAQLEGKLVESRADEVVFEHSVGGAHVRSVFAKTDVAKIEVEFGHTRSADGGVGGVTSSGYPELRDYHRRIAIVLDRSSSMQIGNRYGTALEEVDKLLGEVPDGVQVGIYAFDRKPLPVTESNFVKIDAAFRKKMHDKLEALGVNMTGYTDIVAGLAPAISGEPEAIYLFSDGVPTIGEPSARAVLKGVRDKMNLLPPPKNILIHAIGLHGGKYEFGDPEDEDGAREILKAIAESTGGKYREVEAHPKPEAHLALHPLDDFVPPADAVKFHFYWPDFKPEHEFFLPEFLTHDFLVEVEDPALVQGPVVLEYASRPHRPRIEMRSYASYDPQQSVFDEKTDFLPLSTHMDRNDDLSTFAMLDDIVLGTSVPQRGGTVCARAGVLRLFQTIHLVRGFDEHKRGAHNEDQSSTTKPGQTSFDAGDTGCAYMKVSEDKGTLHVIYRRGNRTFEHVFFLLSTLNDAAVGNGVSGTPGSVPTPLVSPVSPFRTPAPTHTNLPKNGNNKNGGQ